MKITKILILIFILSLSFKTYGNDNYYNESNLKIIEGSLNQTEKGKNYLNKFDIILSKYENNEKALLKLKDKVIELKTKVSGNSYSNDIKNLVSYMDLFINITLNKNFPIIIEEVSTDEDIIEDNVDTSNSENETIVFPGFSDEYNDINKSVIAGDDYIVFSGKTSAYYESVEVGTITFNIEGTDVENLKYSVNNANLYLEGVLIDVASQSDIKVINSDKVTLTFKNIKNFIVPQKEISFRLGISFNPIGYEKIGKNVVDAYIKKVIFSDSTGLSSGNNINSFETDISTEPFSIVAGIPFVTKITDLADSTYIKFNIKGLFGNNTVDENNSTPKLLLNKLRFNYYDSSNQAIFKLVNSGDSNDEIIGSKNNGIVEFDLNSMSSNNKTIGNGGGEDFKILISNTNSFISLELLKNGVLYDVLGVSGGTDLNSNFSSSLDFGTRDY